MTTCKQCRTSDGCETHRMFRCAKCRRIVPWSEGSDDETPDACGACWAKAHAPGACKHENADHRGPDPARFSPTYIAPVEHLVCLDCGEWLSLGPAKLDGERAATMTVEIRAAELADLADSHANRAETRGWIAFGMGKRFPIDDYHWSPQSADESAGWLARAIATHDGGAS